MNNFNPIQVNLRHQKDHTTLKKIQLSGEYRIDPGNAGLFIFVIRLRHFEMISDCNKNTEFKVI